MLLNESLRVIKLVVNYLFDISAWLSISQLFKIEIQYR